jgi:hypothetical protein
MRCVFLFFSWLNYASRGIEMNLDVIEGKRETVQESKVQNVERWSELAGEPRDTHAGKRFVLDKRSRP